MRVGCCWAPGGTSAAMLGLFILAVFCLGPEAFLTSDWSVEPEAIGSHVEGVPCEDSGLSLLQLHQVTQLTDVKMFPSLITKRHSDNNHKLKIQTWIVAAEAG